MCLIEDGGGASGLSSLMILDENMDRLQYSQGLSEPPDIWDYFDIVAGTGTGAYVSAAFAAELSSKILTRTFTNSVSVCMVGRLRIPLKQAIKCYQTLAEVFADKKLISTSGPSMFKTSKLKDVVQKIVRDATGDENSPMVDERPDADRCKTYEQEMDRSDRHTANRWLLVAWRLRCPDTT
jgi:patatin-like phospholipase/acyl hydrolase